MSDIYIFYMGIWRYHKLSLILRCGAAQWFFMQLSLDGWIQRDPLQSTRLAKLMPQRWHFDCRWCPFVFGNLVFQFMVATWIQMSHGWCPSTWPWSIAVPFRRNGKQLLILVALHFARMPPVQCTRLYKYVLYHLVSIFGYGSKAHDRFMTLQFWKIWHFFFFQYYWWLGQYAIRNLQMPEFLVGLKLFDFLLVHFSIRSQLIQSPIYRWFCFENPHLLEGKSLISCTPEVLIHGGDESKTTVRLLCGVLAKWLVAGFLNYTVVIGPDEEVHG